MTSPSARCRDDPPVGVSGLAHTALEIDGGQEQLQELYEKLKRYGATVEFTADHILTRSVHFFDPDGNRLEIPPPPPPPPFCEMMDPEAGREHMRQSVNLNNRSYKPHSDPLVGLG